MIVATSVLTWNLPAFRWPEKPLIRPFGAPSPRLRGEKGV
jgi:hypothetical protein